MYTVLETAEKLLKTLFAVPVTDTSSTAKSVVGSDEVNVNSRLASPVEEPSLTAVLLEFTAVIVIYGSMISGTFLNV